MDNIISIGDERVFGDGCQDSAKMLIYIHNKRIFEAVAISHCNSMNTRPGFYNISDYES